MHLSGNVFFAEMNRLGDAITRAGVVLALIAVTGTVACAPDHGGGLPQAGSRYKIVGPVYLYGDYYDDYVNNRKLSRDAARGYVMSFKFAKKRFTAFRCDVPIGAIMTILGPAPKVLPLPIYASRYFVRIEPVIGPVGLETNIGLDGGIDGNLDGLNPALFARLDEESYVQAKNSLPTSPRCEVYP